MERVEQAVNSLLALFGQAADAVLGWLASAEQWLRMELAQLGVPPQAQTLIMIAAALVLLLIVLRLLGGVIRVVLVIFLILLALHVVLPVAQG